MAESLGMDMCDSQSPEYLYIYIYYTYIYIYMFGYVFLYCPIVDLLMINLVGTSSAHV